MRTTVIFVCHIDVKVLLVHRDTRTVTVEKYLRNLARTMFARANKGACVYLHGIAPLHARPPDGRPLPLELLLQMQHSPNTDNGDEENDAGETA